MKQALNLLLLSVLSLFLLGGCSSGATAAKSLKLPPKGTALHKMLVSTLKSDVAGYHRAVKSKNSAAVLRYTYPTIFQLMPRGNLLRQMKSVMGNPKSPMIKKIKVVKTAPLQSYSKGYFTLLDTETDMLIKTKKKQSLTPENKQWIFGMVGGNSKITSNTNKGFGIKKPGRLLAIKESPNSSWKFIEQEKIVAYENYDLLPEDLLEKLK
jgi:hypothetical protein